MAGESLDGEMVATYAVRVAGFARVKKEAAGLDAAIRSLRRTNYHGGTKGIPVTTVSQARFGTSKGDRLIGKRDDGREDIFVASIDAMEGAVRGGVRDALLSGMAEGRRAQTAALRKATTKTGLSGKSHVGGRNGPGRDDSGDMIAQIATNVEVQDAMGGTNFVGWHGWRRGRSAKIEAQEKGTLGRKSGALAGSLARKKSARHDRKHHSTGVPAANSLGAAIIVVREKLKTSLGALKK